MSLIQQLRHSHCTVVVNPQAPRRSIVPKQRSGQRGQRRHSKAQRPCRARDTFNAQMKCTLRPPKNMKIGQERYKSRGIVKVAAFPRAGWRSNIVTSNGRVADPVQWIIPAMATTGSMSALPRSSSRTPFRASRKRRFSALTRWQWFSSAQVISLCEI